MHKPVRKHLPFISSYQLKKRPPTSGGLEGAELNEGAAAQHQKR